MPARTPDSLGSAHYMYSLDCNGKRLDLAFPVVMGVLNVTPDSFSDGGRFVALDAARGHGERLVLGGADLVVGGGESTRPGANAVSAEEVCRGGLPVIEALAGTLS